MNVLNTYSFPAILLTISHMPFITFPEKPRGWVAFLPINGWERWDWTFGTLTSQPASKEWPHTQICVIVKLSTESPCMDYVTPKTVVCPPLFNSWSTLYGAAWMTLGKYKIDDSILKVNTHRWLHVARRMKSKLLHAACKDQHPLAPDARAAWVTPSSWTRSPWPQPRWALHCSNVLGWLLPSWNSLL